MNAITVIQDQIPPDHCTDWPRWPVRGTFSPASVTPVPQYLSESTKTAATISPTASPGRPAVSTLLTPPLSFCRVDRSPVRRDVLPRNKGSRGYHTSSVYGSMSVGFPLNLALALSSAQNQSGSPHPRGRTGPAAASYPWQSQYLPQRCSSSTARSSSSMTAPTLTPRTLAFPFYSSHRPVSSHTCVSHSPLLVDSHYTPSILVISPFVALNSVSYTLLRPSPLSFHAIHTQCSRLSNILCVLRAIPTHVTALRCGRSAPKNLALRAKAVGRFRSARDSERCEHLQSRRTRRSPCRYTDRCDRETPVLTRRPTPELEDIQLDARQLHVSSFPRAVQGSESPDERHLQLRVTVSTHTSRQHQDQTVRRLQLE